MSRIGLRTTHVSQYAIRIAAVTSHLFSLLGMNTPPNTSVDADVIELLEDLDEEEMYPKPLDHVDILTTIGNAIGACCICLDEKSVIVKLDCNNFVCMPCIIYLTTVNINVHTLDVQLPSFKDSFNCPCCRQTMVMCAKLRFLFTLFYISHRKFKVTPSRHLTRVGHRRSMPDQMDRVIRRIFGGSRRPSADYFNSLQRLRTRTFARIQVQYTERIIQRDDVLKDIRGQYSTNIIVGALYGHRYCMFFLHYVQYQILCHPFTHTDV